MIRKSFLVRITACLSAAAVCSTAAAGQLRSIDLSATPDSAVITLALSDGPAAKVFTLENPDRAVIDLPRTHADHLVVPAGSGLVTDVRVGQQPGGTLRLVLELRSAVAVKSSSATGKGGRQLTVSLGEPAAAAAADTGPKTVRAAHAPGDGDRDVIIAVDRKSVV